jgi:hypothetical protein
MPTKNNHINVNVKNVIKLDHSKKKTKRKRQKNKTNKISLIRPNNSVYDPNSITLRTGDARIQGGSIQYPINKSGYDMKPRIGFIDPNSDTISTNLTQQLLLENQKYNDDKTNQTFINYHEKIENGMKAYHDQFLNGMSKYHKNFIDPLKNQIHILQSDFDSYKTSTNPKINYPQSPLEEDYRNDETNDESNNNRYLEYKDPYFTFPDIYNSKNADNSDAKENYPILTSNNADIFSPPPFAEFVLNNFPNPNLNKDFEVQSVDEEDDEDKLPKNNAIVETVLVPQYLSLINNLESLKFINTNEGLNIDTKGLKNYDLKKKIIEKLGKDASIVYLPADKLTDKQIADGEKIKQKKGK